MFIRCYILSCVLLAVNVGALNQLINTECGHARRRRLVGGREDDNCERPYAVLLRFGPLVQCSGAIVSPTTELTAARCFEGDVCPNNSFAFAGNVWFKHVEDFEPPTQVRKLSLCRRYNALQPQEYDVMFCKHDDPWVFHLFVSPVDIFFFTDRLRSHFRLKCHVVGFGRVNNDLEAGYMHSYEQVMETWRKCRKEKSDQFMCTVDTQTKTMCAGDEGGPVTCMFHGRRQLFGLLSGSSQTVADSCQAPVDWNIVSFLGHYRDWLLFNIPELKSYQSLHQKGDSDDTTTQKRIQITTPVIQSIKTNVPEHRFRVHKGPTSVHTCLPRSKEKSLSVAPDAQSTTHTTTLPRKRLHSEMTSVHSTLTITNKSDRPMIFEHQNMTKNTTLLGNMNSKEKVCSCAHISTSEGNTETVTPSSLNFTCPCLTAPMPPQNQQDPCHCSSVITERVWISRERQSGSTKATYQNGALLAVSFSILMYLCHSETTGILLTSIIFTLENKYLNVQYMWFEQYLS